VNGRRQELSLMERLDERPRFELAEVRKANARELGYRFIAGAVTSVMAGIVTLVFGARVGGILLAFPAILAASLTLISEEEDSAMAREDARGAMAGGCGLVAFAVVGALTFGALSGALALLLSAIAWAVTALGIYVLLWWR
jgi:Protein of unknown function (DUF3147)